jgi:hypothetical protein
MLKMTIEERQVRFADATTEEDMLKVLTPEEARQFILESNLMDYITGASKIQIGDYDFTAWTREDLEDGYRYYKEQKEYYADAKLDILQYMCNCYEIAMLLIKGEYVSRG